jgi:hypothetical protein
MAAAPIIVELLGREHAVRLPLFAEREELVSAAVEASRRGLNAQLRVLSAAIGLGTRLGAESGADYAATRCEPLVYGGLVYGFLRERGATPVDIRTAGKIVLDAMALSLAPRESEVAAAQVFTRPSEGPST